jgi:hypothetical protein
MKSHETALKRDDTEKYNSSMLSSRNIILASLKVSHLSQN